MPSKQQKLATLHKPKRPKATHRQVLLHYGEYIFVLSNEHVLDLIEFYMEENIGINIHDDPERIIEAIKGDMGWRMIKAPKPKDIKMSVEVK